MSHVPLNRCWNARSKAMHEKFFVYLHGFASSSNAYKGTSLKSIFGDQGVTLHTPDLNIPSFGDMTYSSILDALDGIYLANPVPWYIIGSSMGGYLAARWAEKHPERVRAMVLLCPAFDLPGRWEKDHGTRLMEAWKEAGYLAIPDSTGRPNNLHWSFIDDARTHPTHPASSVPTLIIHGRRDETVPIESSRAYVATHTHIELIEVDDDHGLGASVDRIASEGFRFFERNSPDSR